jgi:hypothetical protein
MPAARWYLLVWCALASVFAVSTVSRYEAYTFLPGDSAFYATVNRSLLDGKLEQHDHQPRSWYEQDLGWNRELDAGWSNIALGVHGEWWPKHPLLLPILGTPFFALLGYDGLLLFNVLMFITSLLLAFRIAARICRPEAAALAVTVVAMLPVFTRVAYSYSNDILYTVLAVGAIDLFLTERWAWSGLLFGLAIVSKPTTAVLALPFGAWLLATKRWRPALRMVAGAVPPVLAWLTANWWMFGHPLTTAYNRILVRVHGQPTLADVASRFHRPWSQGWREIFADREEGLLSQAWLSLVGVLGLPWLARLQPWLAGALTLSLAAFFWLYVPFEWTYARFFLPWATLLAVPLAVGLDRLALAVERLLRPDGRRWLWAGLAGVGLATSAWAAVRGRETHRWSAATDIAHAQVGRDEGPRASPCDYFNPSQQKWECASHEPDSWQRWGLALGDQCRFDDGSRGWLWLHPNPTVAKQILWPRVPAGVLHVEAGLAPSARHRGLEVRLSGGERPLHTWQLGAAGDRQTWQTPWSGGVLRVNVPLQASDWRHLCLRAWVD